MNKQILITGSSRGIGRASALHLAAKGYDIVLHCKSNIAAAEEVAKQIEAMGQKTRLLVFDVNDRQGAADCLLKDVAEHGAYYGVVCNAGISADAAFPAMTDEDWDSVVNTSLNGFYNILRPIVMEMVRSRKQGRIVTLASVSGVIGNRGQVNYSAAKAGVIGATRALAVELAKRNITVNCVAPGLIETDMTEGLEMEHILAAIPMKRAGKANEVASLIAYLMSDEAAYITRQVISVNGGLI